MSGSDKGLKELRRDGVQFFAAWPHHLGRVVSTPQAVDNQWMPQALLASVMSGGQPDDDQVEQQRQPHVRREYIRGLVNTGQLVINRAFLYNNAGIYQDYITPGETREAFKTLLDRKIIVPYLYDESSPVTEPRFTKRDLGWKAWVEVVKESVPTCVRQSWDESEGQHEDENTILIRRNLRMPFRKFLRTIDDLEVPLLVDDLSIQATDLEEFAARLRQVAQWANKRVEEKEWLNREDVYREFVVAPGTDPGDRIYDPRKPFAAEVKQLVDLRYDANLPDSFGSYLLTPDQSLRRRALQEWKAVTNTGETDAEQLIRVLSNLNFDQVSAVLDAPSAFERLTLRDVLELRDTPQWAHYHNVLDEFLADGTLDAFGDASHGAEPIALAYRDVVERAGAISAARIRSAVQDRWDPVIEIAVEFAGAILSVFYDPAGKAFRVARDISPGVGTRTAKAVFHFVMGRITRSQAAARIDNSLRMLDTRLAGGKDDWVEFVAGLKKQGFRELDRDPGSGELGSMERAAASE